MTGVNGCGVVLVHLIIHEMRSRMSAAAYLLISTNSFPQDLSVSLRVPLHCEQGTKVVLLAVLTGKLSPLVSGSSLLGRITAA
jgi:hypothetical protein